MDMKYDMIYEALTSCYSQNEAVEILEQLNKNELLEFATEYEYLVDNSYSKYEIIHEIVLEEIVFPLLKDIEAIFN